MARRYTRPLRGGLPVRLRMRCCRSRPHPP